MKSFLFGVVIRHQDVHWDPNNGNPNNKLWNSHNIRRLPPWPCPYRGRVLVATSKSSGEYGRTDSGRKRWTRQRKTGSLTLSFYKILTIFNPRLAARNRVDTRHPIIPKASIKLPNFSWQIKVESTKTTSPSSNSTLSTLQRRRWGSRCKYSYTILYLYNLKQPKYTKNNESKCTFTIEPRLANTHPDLLWL